MIHSPSELGSLGEAVAKIHTEQFGEESLQILLTDIENYWETVRERVIAVGLYKNSTSLHVFVDGLPNVTEDIIRKMVADLIAARSVPAYQIISVLQKHGAIVHGTEDIKLLLQEYYYYKGLTEGKCADEVAALARLEARDVAISKRIQEIMLNDGDRGILFIGKAHKVIDQLPHDFTVIAL